MSRRSANFTAFPVLTQDSQGPQRVRFFTACSAHQIPCIGSLSKNTERREKASGRVDAPRLTEADTEKSDQFDRAADGVVSTVQIANAEQTSDDERQQG